MRHGNRNRVEGNYFFGNGKVIGTSPAGSTIYTGGVRIYGTDHMIINNYMEGLNGTRWDAPITLTQGDAIDGQSSSLSKHFRAERVTIAYNTLVNNSHGIEIGYDNNNNYNKELDDITIANNIVTGSENSLVEIVDTDNDQGDRITWLSNLMYPTGGATLLAGATSTSFDALAISNENPHLVFDDTYNTWRSTLETPTYESAISSAMINEDIDGQDRPSNSNPGADHYSMESVRYAPLTANDVGPYAYEDTSTSTSNGYEISETLLYPIPTDNILYISNIDPKLDKVSIVNLKGEIISNYGIQIGAKILSINTSKLMNGIYFVQLFKNEVHSDSRKIVIQH